MSLPDRSELEAEWGLDIDGVYHVGEHYGTHFPLKPGVEVVIGFVEGDPDRPVILGAVPDAIHRSPVDARNPGVHRIMTSSGIRVDMHE